MKPHSANCGHVNKGLYMVILSIINDTFIWKVDLVTYFCWSCISLCRNQVCPSWSLSEIGFCALDLPFTDVCTSTWYFTCIHTATQSFAHVRTFMKYVLNGSRRLWVCKMISSEIERINVIHIYFLCQPIFRRIRIRPWPVSSDQPSIGADENFSNVHLIFLISRPFPQYD